MKVETTNRGLPTSTIPEAYPIAKRSPSGDSASADIDDVSLRCVLGNVLTTLKTGLLFLSNNSGALDSTTAMGCIEKNEGSF